MTFLEKLKIEKPDVRINEFGPKGCPANYGYSDYKVGTSTCPLCEDPDSIPHKCLDCWNQEIPEKEVMTYAKKRMEEHSYTMEELASDFCPYEFDYERCEDRPCEYMEDTFVEGEVCVACWDREIPEETYTLEEVKEILDITDEDIEEAVDAINEVGNPNPMTSEDFNKALEVSRKVILDSGERRQFETGAVRDIQEGKGRCDLMPLDVIAAIYHHHKEDCHESWIFWHLDKFKRDGEIKHLLGALDMFRPYDTVMTMFLEVAKHFEEGAKKYGENNWQKGIPTKHYIDSAIRHYLKYLRGDQDEPHDRAFVWNIMCCIWTCKNMPELNSYRKDEEDGN